MAEGLMAILGAGKKGSKPKAGAEETDPSIAAKADAIEDFFAKGNAGDYTGAAEAFQRAYDICVDAHASEEPEEEMLEE